MRQHGRRGTAVSATRRLAGTPAASGHHWSRHHVERVFDAPELGPHPAEHFLPLVFLAGLVFLLGVAVLLLAVAVVAAVLVRRLALGGLLDVEALDAHALRFQRRLQG